VGGPVRRSRFIVLSIHAWNQVAMSQHGHKPSDSPGVISSQAKVNGRDFASRKPASKIKYWLPRLLAMGIVLAAAGVGVYELSGRLLVPQVDFAGKTAAPTVQNDQKESVSTLDAVATAWLAEGESSSAAHTATSPLVNMAIQPPMAEASLPKVGRLREAATEPKVAELTVDLPEQALVPVGPPTSDKTSLATITATAAAKVVGDRYGNIGNSQPDTITRGQEPAPQQDLLPKNQSLPTVDPAKPNQAPTTTPEVASTTNPPQIPITGAATERARNAFGGETQPSSDQRYNESGSNLRASPAGDGQLNPFAQQPAPLPAPSQEAQPLVPHSASSATNRYDNEPKQISSLEPNSPDGAATPSSVSAFQQPQPVSPRNQLNPRIDTTEQNGIADATVLDSSETTGLGYPGEQALEGAQQPALLVRKIAPTEIQVGKPAKFRIQVRNVGDRPASDVVVRDPIPQGTRLLGSTPRAELINGELHWQLGTLSVGEERELEVNAMPTAEGEIGSVATVTFTTHASVKVRCTLPQLALRLSAPDEVMVGSEQRVKIELHNPGSGDATGVILLENVPEELRHTAGPALEFEVGTLRVGETRKMELVLTAEKAGPVINRIIARGDGDLKVEQEIKFDVIAPALKIGVEGPGRRYLNKPATYTVHVGNPGTATAKDIELTTKLPKGMQFVRADNLGEYDSATHAVYWSLAELGKGTVGAVKLTTLPTVSGNHEIQVEGKASQGLEDQTTQHIVVEGIAAVTFKVTDLEDPIEVGGETTYEIHVINEGSKAASDVQVTATLPSGMRVVSAEGKTAHSIKSQTVVFEPLESLAPKTDTTFRVTAQGVQPGHQRLTVQIGHSELTEPLRTEENTRVFGNE
jgi:uncharacterized repeat protein (TIGR01451 family)